MLLGRLQGKPLEGSGCGHSPEPLPSGVSRGGAAAAPDLEEMNSQRGRTGARPAPSWGAVSGVTTHPHAPSARVPGLGDRFGERPAPGGPPAGADSLLPRRPWTWGRARVPS